MLVAQELLGGNVAQWLIVAIGVFAAWRISRGGGGSAVAELDRANKVLDHSLHLEREKSERLGGEVRDLRIENAALKEQTNFASALAGAISPLIEWTHVHEERAQQRFDAQLKVMDLVAARLGPDADVTDQS